MKTITIEFVDGKKDIKIQAKDLKSAVELLVKQRTDLRYADLSGANLKNVILNGADLRETNLSGADLSRADLKGADLYEANLSKADLSEADLSEADLEDADLSKTDLKRANLIGANLSRANLFKADLYGAYLSGAILRGGVDLYEADLTDVKGLDYQICPEKGSFIAYKATTTGVIKIEILKDAKRTSCISSRKCRASKVKVISGDGCGGASPTCTDKPLVYNKGCIIESDSFNDDPREKCTNGIHFFMTKQEAINWFKCTI